MKDERIYLFMCLVVFLIEYWKSEKRRRVPYVIQSNLVPDMKSREIPDHWFSFFCFILYIYSFISHPLTKAMKANSKEKSILFPNTTFCIIPSDPVDTQQDEEVRVCRVFADDV